MEKFYEKLKTLDKKKVKIVQIISGLICGLIIWGVLRLSGEATDKLLAMSFLLVFVIIMVLQNKIGKNTGWNMQTFRMCMIISLGACIVAFVIYCLATGQLF